ncbi:hypothetical protein OUZ56_005989 [Daphnia magna]|uniref:Uncharacterized protein n=1 Tax=Daphnia magna TaxID=35525 RepID=A0ABQ9YUB6_9CRUS|nr:hypothetical protein OUZ56_005989 [Daphnia magna]
MGRKGGVVAKDVVDHPNYLGHLNESSVRVEITHGSPKKLVTAPRGHEDRQMLAIGVERDLEISIGGVEGTEELGVAGYFRDSIARRISGSVDMCHPLGWFRDQFDDAFVLQFVQLLLYFWSVGECNGSGAVNIIRNGVVFQADDHFWSVHASQPRRLVEYLSEFRHKFLSHALCQLVRRVVRIFCRNDHGRLTAGSAIWH